MKLHSITLTIATVSSVATSVNAFSPIRVQQYGSSTTTSTSKLFHAPTEQAEATTTTSFIATELRGAAMKLHTRAQSPKEGQAAEKPKPKERYVPTHMDYLKFLVDSQAVYQTFEEIIKRESLHPELEPLVDTGLERSARLEQDIEFMTKEYNLERPDVGDKGRSYSDKMMEIASKGKDGVPEFMCHYYNYYFAHTAGGRMIGKQMASLLLEKKTLEFYKWDGDINKIKETVKTSIEDMAASWSREQKDQCVEGTADAFIGGGGINAYLSGGQGGHH
jgi:heme oxygenase|eukprot:35676_1